MANIVIVTKQCYLLCERINYITMCTVDKEEEKENIFSLRKRKRRLTKAEKEFLKLGDLHQIIIDFIPVASTNGPGNGNSRNNGDTNHTVAITVRGQDRCLALYQDMVSQIREQIPDQLFLDRLVEKFLTDTTTKS